MSLFGKKTKKAENSKDKAPVTASSADLSSIRGKLATGYSTNIVLRPRVTEKAHSMAEGRNVYVFDVLERATKGQVKNAVRDLFKVHPEKVAIVPVPKKTKVVRGKMGVSGGGRKAYVHLESGEKIEVV